MFWRCGCGEEFPGTTSGFYGGLLTHRRERKARGEACPPIVGLFDVAGERLANSINEARQLGFLSTSNTKTPPRTTSAGTGRTHGKNQVSSTTRAKMRFQDVELDPSLWILFDLARLKWPDEYEETPESFARWLEECVFCYYMEHAKELGFNILLAKSLKRLGFR